MIKFFFFVCICFKEELFFWSEMVHLIPPLPMLLSRYDSLRQVEMRCESAFNCALIVWGGLFFFSSSKLGTLSLHTALLAGLCGARSFHSAGWIVQVRGRPLGMRWRGRGLMQINTTLCWGARCIVTAAVWVHPVDSVIKERWDHCSDRGRSQVWFPS